MHTHTPHAVAALRILLTVAWVFGVALWPMTLWRWQLISVVMLLALTVGVRLPLRTLVRRVAVVWLLTGVMSLGLFGQPGWSLRAGNLLLKSTLSDPHRIESIGPAASSKGHLWPHIGRVVKSRRPDFSDLGIYRAHDLVHLFLRRKTSEITEN